VPDVRTPETSLRTLTIHVELVPASAEISDQSAAAEEARDLVSALRRGGYLIETAYTQERGGQVFDILLQVAHKVHDNKELITARFGLLAALIKYLSDTRKDRNSKIIGLRKHQRLC
jgi:hypothetical protein